MSTNQNEPIKTTATNDTPDPIATKRTQVKVSSVNRVLLSKWLINNTQRLADMTYRQACDAATRELKFIIPLSAFTEAVDTLDIKIKAEPKPRRKARVYGVMMHAIQDMANYLQELYSVTGDVPQRLRDIADGTAFKRHSDKE